jgi:glutaredoxin
MKTLTIYSTPTCTHCRTAKEYLSSLGIDYNEINLHEDAEAMSQMRSRGHRSVPQIYLADQLFVNSWTELQNMSAEQILEKINA